jgi:ANTAR domain
MSHEPWEDNRPLPRSLQPLAQIALQEAGADGYAIYQVDPKTDARELKFAGGAPVPESGAAVPKSGNAGCTVTSFPLHAGDEVTGVLTFVFRDAAVFPRAQSVLERIASAIEEVWRLSLVPETYARNAARIGELEAELADSKIADRACGLLAAGPPPPDAIDTIARHVESVLRPGQLAGVLGQLIVEIQQEIAERDLANRAKALLQSRYGMSEDQAHVHLRLVSRKSRKRLRDVARDVLEESVLQNGR